MGCFRIKQNSSWAEINKKHNKDDVRCINRLFGGDLVHSTSCLSWIRPDRWLQRRCWTLRYCRWSDQRQTTCLCQTLICEVSGTSVVITDHTRLDIVDIRLPIPINSWLPGARRSDIRPLMKGSLKILTMDGKSLVLLWTKNRKMPRSATNETNNFGIFLVSLVMAY